MKQTLKFFPFAVNWRSSNCKKKETRWNYILKHLCGGSENIEFEWDRTWTKSLSMLWSFPLDCKSESHFATSVDYCRRRSRHRRRSTPLMSLQYIPLIRYLGFIRWLKHILIWSAKSNLRGCTDLWIVTMKLTSHRKKNPMNLLVNYVTIIFNLF